MSTSRQQCEEVRKPAETVSFPSGIDYPALAECLLKLGVTPHMVIEPAVEKETPKTIAALGSHRRNRKYVDRVFGRFAG